MWSFVGFKENKQWIWLAIDADTREVVGVFISEREAPIGKAAMAIITCGLPSVRYLLHRFLVSL